MPGHKDLKKSGPAAKQQKNKAARLVIKKAEI